MQAWIRPMVGRPIDDVHREPTPLELLFDLCFVVAVSQAAGRLHHALAAGEAAEGAFGYVVVFFALWWAWMNVTWFASAYDTDDVPYRLVMFVQITGVLVLAAGVPAAFDRHDFRLPILGYVIVRIGLVGQWLRAARGNPEGRATALRFAAGVSACQCGWMAVAFVPHPAQWWGLLLVPAELAVPVWAEHAGRTPWNPYHVDQRYGLFTLIVLGESILAATVAARSAVGTGHVGSLLVVGSGGLLVVFSMWWLYFGEPSHDLLVSNRQGFVWGYGHFFVFASAAAVGTGLTLTVDRATGHAELPATGAAVAVTVPVAVFLVSTWALHVRTRHGRSPRSLLWPVTAVLVLAGTFSPAPVPTTGLLGAALVTATVVLPPPEPDAGGGGRRARVSRGR